MFKVHLFDYSFRVLEGWCMITDDMCDIVFAMSYWIGKLRVTVNPCRAESILGNTKYGTCIVNTTVVEAQGVSASATILEF